MLVKPLQMRKLIELKSGANTILVEADDVQYHGGVVQAGGPIDKNIDKILEKLQPFCESIISYFEKLTLKPTTASAEFGVDFTIEGNIFIAKASAEASVKVTLNWTLNSKNAAGS